MSPSHTELGAPLLKAPALFTQCPTRRISLKKEIEFYFDPAAVDDESKVYVYESELVWFPHQGSMVWLIRGLLARISAWRDP